MTQPRFTRLPARSVKDYFQFVLPAGKSFGITPHVNPVVGLHVEWIVTFDRMYESVNGRLVRIFRLESAEQPIPDDENARIILINVLGIAAMMNTMVTWSVENIFQRSECGDDFGVQPEHVQFTHLKMRQENTWRNSDPCKRDVGELDDVLEI